MGRHKKEVELTTSLQQETISTENIVKLTSNLTEETVIETKPEPTIFDKYRHYIVQAQSNFCRISYPELMEVLRFCESKVGHNIPLNTSCPVCIIDIVKLFSRLENK